jgi:hypothetical protein
MPEAPSVSTTKFHRQNGVSYEGLNTPGMLHRTKGVESVGFLRGSSLEVGDHIVVTSKDERRTWKGFITGMVSDDYGAVYYFSVWVTKHPGQTQIHVGNGDTIQVTVTNPSGGQSSTTTTDPQPSDVP